ncbi:hypothetical protein LINPERPRIM_LOCUS7915 [Linum perenne]
MVVQSTNTFTTTLLCSVSFIYLLLVVRSFLLGNWIIMMGFRSSTDDRISSGFLRRRRSLMLTVVVLTVCIIVQPFLASVQAATPDQFHNALSGDDELSASIRSGFKLSTVMRPGGGGGGGGGRGGGGGGGGRGGGGSGGRGGKGGGDDEGGGGGGGGIGVSWGWFYRLYGNKDLGLAYIS